MGMLFTGINLSYFSLNNCKSSFFVNYKLSRTNLLIMSFFGVFSVDFGFVGGGKILLKHIV